MMTEKLENLDVLCRLCLSIDGRVPIFPDGENKDDLSVRIFECVYIQVKRDGKLPLNVCSSCLSYIDSWYAFKEKCHQTQATLSSMIGEPSSSKEDGIALCNGDSEPPVEDSVGSEEYGKGCDEVPKTAADTHDEATRDVEMSGQDGVPGVVDSGNVRTDVSEIVANDTEITSNGGQKCEDMTPSEPRILDGSAELSQPSPENGEGQQSTRTSISEEIRSAETEKPTESSAAVEGPANSEPLGKSNGCMLETEILRTQLTTDREEEQSDLDDSREDVMEEDEEEEYDDFVDEGEFDEPASAQLVNPKFAAKLMNAKPDSSPSSFQRPSSPCGPVQTVDLCEDDDDVCLVEPEIQKIVLDGGDSNDSVKKEPASENPDGSTTDQGKNEISLRIESAVTLPGDLLEKADQLSESRDANEAALPDGAEDEHITTARSSRDNSPDRMSADGSMIEDDQFEDDESSQLLPPSVGENSRTTPDSTMVSSNTEEPEPYIPLAFDDIKQEAHRGYADEYTSLAYNQASSIQGKSRDEYERELLAGDTTVDVNNDRCIICDHKFHNISSLLRHTKCKTHIINKTIILKREMGAPIDPKTQALHDRHMRSYRNQWNSGKRRNYPSQGVGAGPKKFACKLCRVVAISARDLERHKASRKHKLCVMMGGLPVDEEASLLKPPARKIIKPQLLQYSHEERPQHKVSTPKIQHGQREYICPIPNCGYVCYEGSVLLTHMTSHGIQGQGPSPQQSSAQLPSLTHKPTLPTPSPSHPVESKPVCRSGKYENLFCKYHNVYFETARGYLNHIRTCTMAPPISTFLKKEYTQSADDLQRYCKLCDLSFSTPDMLIQHMNVYHKGATSQKEQDLSKFKVLAPVYTPKPMPQIKSNRKHKCHLCGKVFNLLHSLNFHLRTHQSHVSSSTSSNTTCKVCKKSFATRKSCASHLKTHFLPPGSNKLFCSTCYKTFNTRVEICKHRFDGTCHAPTVSGESFPCDQCSLSFKDATILSNHKLRFHPDIKQEKIDEQENNEQGEEQAEALTYQQESTPQSEVPQVAYEDEATSCMLCGKEFSSFFNLKRHCRFIHRMPESNIIKMAASMGVSPSKMQSPPAPQRQAGSQQSPKKTLNHNKSCNRCGETFYHTKQLLDHQQACQEPVREVCQQCGMQTDAQGCPNCDARAAEPKDAGESSSLLFKCPIGHMSFNDENAMLKHYSYCTGKCGPYFECGSCGCEFRYRKNFDTHDCALSRKKTTYDCTECHRSFTKKSYLMNHEMKCPHLNSPGSFPEPAAPPPPPPSAHPTSSNCMKKTRQSGPLDEPHVELPLHSDKPLEVFTCEQCEKIFHSNKALNGHMWIHKKATPENQMFCKFCGKENLSLSNLYSHVYKCVRSLFMTEEVLTCEDCSTFLSRYDTPKELSAKLHVHVLNCYPIPWYQNEGEVEGSDKILCYICCHAFSSVESLTIHKIQHKKAKAKRNSPFCKTSPKKRPRYGHFSAPKIEIDINDMIEEEVFESEDSSTFASTSSSLATTFILNCQVCNRQFHNIDKLRNHEKVHGIVRQVVNESEEVDVVGEA